VAYVCDTFGPRLCGSSNLESAIDWILEKLRADGFQNVHSEPVAVPNWHRGKESLQLVFPRSESLQILGLGGSVGTSNTGLKADVLVVSNFEELQKKSEAAAGKIVLYDVPFTTYSETVQYRTRGAVEAAKAGAVASLVRSVSPLSLQTPHTGATRYDSCVTTIPHAAITLEASAMLKRMQESGVVPRLHLTMGAKTLPDVLSRNIIAELKGSDIPEEIIVIGGHIDSWDVGQGAHDDAGGCVVSWQAIKALIDLDLHPRRTIRLVFWTNEENGLRGAKAYFEQHIDEMDHHILAIENDAGIFAPTGFAFSGNDSLREIVRYAISLLSGVGVTELSNGGGGADIGNLMNAGVAGLSLTVDNSKYLWYHHSPADTFDKIDNRDFNKCTAALAVMLYVLSDFPGDIVHQETFK